MQKIISGGQTGADQAGLRAAKFLGIPTGGWLPKDCMTLDGPRPDLIDLYSMREHTGGYAARTEANVRDADGTIRIAEFFSSPGEKRTKRAIKWFNKVWFDVDVKNPPDPEKVRTWLKENNIAVLNVAGNAEQTSPGIGDFAYRFLLTVFSSENPSVTDKNDNSDNSDPGNEDGPHDQSVRGEG